MTEKENVEILWTTKIITPENLAAAAVVTRENIVLTIQEIQEAVVMTITSMKEVVGILAMVIVIAIHENQKVAVHILGATEHTLFLATAEVASGNSSRAGNISKNIPNDEAEVCVA